MNKGWEAGKSAGSMCSPESLVCEVSQIPDVMCKVMASGKLLYRTGSSAWCSVMT